MSVQTGTIIYLNGTSSAGKGTLARAIQRAMDEPYLHVGADTMFEALDGTGYNRAGLAPDSRTRSGVFWQVDAARRLVSIEFGEHGRAMMRGLHAAVAGLANEGNHVVVDDVLFEPDMAHHAGRVLADLPAYLVAVRCDPAELERRETARGDRIVGLSLWLHDRVHRHVPNYDLEIDTTATDADLLAQRVRSYVEGRPTPSAFAALRDAGGR